MYISSSDKIRDSFKIQLHWFYYDDGVFKGVQTSESNFSEAMRDIEPNSFGGPS